MHNIYIIEKLLWHRSTALPPSIDPANDEQAFLQGLFGSSLVVVGLGLYQVIGRNEGLPSDSIPVLFEHRVLSLDSELKMEDSWDA